MPKGKLLRSDQSDLAATVRRAIGAGLSESVTVVTPQFERPEHWPPVEHPPALPSEWNALRAMTKAELLSMGLGNWDGRLMLFPGKWYAFIPEGFEVETISGGREKFQRGVTDDDIRFGSLAYGIPAIDGVEVPER